MVKDMERGIVVGSDLSQEWLLPWWWEHYRVHNPWPVAFIDFGMTEGMRAWCRERGIWMRLRLADIFVKGREEVAPGLVSEWEGEYGDNFWGARGCWFRKPHACLLSPFEKSIWLDLDCQVMGSLQPLFEIEGVGLAKDRIAPTYNSGVIVFPKNHSLIQEWAQNSLEKTGAYRGDQDLLSDIIREKRFSIHELSPLYNWNVGFGKNQEAVICHWLGENAKIALRNQRILSEL